MKNKINKLRKLSKKLDYRFYLTLTNNTVDKEKGYWVITAFPYIMGYPELKSKCKTLEKAIEKGMIFLEKIEKKMKGRA